MGVFGTLFVIFLVLKLTEISVVATWSWWWITAPLWAPFPAMILGSIMGVSVLRILVSPLEIFAWNKRRKNLKAMMEEDAEE